MAVRAKRLADALAPRPVGMDAAGIAGRCHRAGFVSSVACAGNALRCRHEAAPLELSSPGSGAFRTTFSSATPVTPMAECAVCREPTANGTDYCADHADQASAAKTELLRLDALGLPLDDGAPTPLSLNPIAPAPGPAPTAELPPPAPVVRSRANLPPWAEPDEDLIVTAARRLSEPARPPDLIATLVPLAPPAPAPPSPAATLVPPAPVSRPKRPGTIIGRLLGGRFEVKSHLGSGGFGATYVAYDQRLRRECVIKMLRPLSADPSPFEIELRKRFSNEALTLAHLIHPNITQVFDHGEEADGANWIAMEIVRGRALSDIGREEKQLDCVRVARLGSQLAGALAFAHSRGIVHRDLKPDNVIVVEHQTGGEQPKVLDFGIARITDPQALGLDQSQAQLTNVGAFLGTPAFMSPEQAEGAPVGPASDVYSLGVVLYLLVTGRLPGTVPSAWNPMTTIAYVVSPFEPVRRIRPDCPPLLAESIEAMLVKPAHERTLSAAQVEADLRMLEPTTSQRATARSQAMAPRRSLLPAITLGAVVVALGAVLALYLATRPSGVKPPVAAAAAPLAVPPDPRLALREGAIAEVLRDARAGKPSAVVDPEADALLKDGADARLVLAKGLAHLTDEDWDGAVSLLGLVAQGSDATVAQEASAQLVIARAGQAAAHARRPKPRPPPPREPKLKPKPVQRPDY